MFFLMLWLTLGLSLLVFFGIEEVVTYIGLDATEEEQSSVFYALCLTIMVVAWPMILMEYVQKHP